jgi:hypothetical protein
LLEAGLALGLLLLIVWSTWPKGKPEPKKLASKGSQVTGLSEKEKLREVARERAK